MGLLDDRFEEPNSLECVKFVNKTAEDNWSRYTAEEMTALTGHLIRYPIQVEADGKKLKLKRLEIRKRTRPKEMVSGFHRSLSLPGSNRLDEPCHLRSTSLPCRPHPALAHLMDQIRSCPDPCTRCSSPAAGLDRIDRLLAALDDLLRLPLAQDALRRGPAWADRLLDGFLRLVDAHGSLRSAATALGQHNVEARAAIRRRDPVRLASAARSHRRVEKELARLASTVKDLARSAHLTPGLWAEEADVEVVGFIGEAVAATAAASMAVFLAIAAVSSSAAASLSKGSWTDRALRRAWRRRSEEGAMEESIEGLEEGSGRVFRSLVNMRVALLNILTPSL
ncbi:hypothetical protein BHE74_00014556 [Ensete ventricosum]|nr:hypothetical protein GW17_00000270 [Ensete ventricosum]RWW77286.1 hypothetical protein BHE74_00014556 [Ensete ventricosum]